MLGVIKSAITGLSTAPYRVLQNWPDNNVELREYEDANWVYNDQTGPNMDSLMSSCFSKNFNYITGGNEDKASIAMTTPVFVDMKENSQDPNDNVYKMGFYIDKAVYSDPEKIPKPKVEGAYIKNIPSAKYYVRLYSGYSNTKVFHDEAESLKNNLRELGLKFDENVIRFAGYDPPYKFYSRRNEVLIPAL